MNRRIIFFGRFAGLAGMINTLWAIGLRLKEYNIETPFLKIRQAYTYSSLEEARTAVADVGLEIAEGGLPSELQPFVVGITGYGNVSQGVQEILGLLPVKEIMVNRLTELSSRKSAPTNLIYKVIFRQQDLVRHTNASLPFDLHDYYQHPHNYINDFEQYIPHLSTLINGMYWDEKFPKLITRNYLQEHMKEGRLSKLHVIGDITCDPEGSIEATLKGSSIENPLYVYNPDNHSIKNGHTSTGLQVMAVDILPSELPKESSEAFGNVLFNFVKSIAAADYSRSYDEIDLPKPIKRAMIVHNGELTPSYKYLEKYL
jgi:alpha-aminoadipic semialdehyde synthase